MSSKRRVNTINQKKIVGMGFSNDLPLQQFRTGTTSKSIAITTITFFLWTFFAAPLANAIEADNLKQQQKEAQLDAMYETSPEATLSYRLQKLKDKITHDIPQQQSQQNFWDKTKSAFGGLPINNSQLDGLTSIEIGIWKSQQEGMKGFDQDEQKISQNKKISPQLKKLALQRHQEAKKQIENRFRELQTKLNTLHKANKKGDQQQAFEDLKSYLDKQQFQKGHTKVDPNHLPFGTPEPNKRTPLENETALYTLTHDSVQVASNVLTAEILGPKYTQRGGTQADLAETIDTTQTQAIKDLALQLNNDPIQIYTWVANNIQFVPSYGSIQGADMTLQTKRGNDMDTASLLIALLRAAHIPARYAYGTVQMPIDKAMNWVGGVTVPAAAANLMQQGGIPTSLVTTQGVITHVKFEHTWVEAFVDYEPSRGTKNIEGDNWVPMDASYKQYDYTQPSVDLKTAVPFDAQGLANTIQQNTTVNESEGWVQSNPANPAQLQTQIQTALTDYQTQLQSYLQNQHPDATVGDVLGLQQIKILPARPLAAGLPYHLIAKQSPFSEVADNMRLKFKYELYTESYGEPEQLLFKVEQPTVQLAGKKLAMSFKPATQQDTDLIASYIPAPDATTGQIDPAKLPKSLPGYLIHLIPEFTIDNTTVTSVTQSATMGTELISEMGYQFPNKEYETTQNLPIAGQYEAIALDLQGISSQQAQKLQTNLQNMLNSLESNNLTGITKHQVVGDLLYTTVMGYFALNDAEDNIFDKNANRTSYRSASYGLFRTDITTQYYFGLPRNVQASGMMTDIDRYYTISTQKDNNQQVWVQNIRAIGSRVSSMEARVPEQIFSTANNPVHGISAVDALQQAAAQGQRIYTITQNNIDGAIPKLNLPAGVIDEIQSAAASGKIVTVHQVPVNFYGNMQIGYTVIDPQTGSGAYQIANGENGGFLDNYPSGLVNSLFATIGVLSIFSGSAGILASITIVISILAIFNLLITFMISDLKLKDNGCPDMMTDLLVGVTAMFFFLPKAVSDKLVTLAFSFASTMYKPAIAAAAPACNGI